jgi:hypothetical protein
MIRWAMFTRMAIAETDWVGTIMQIAGQLLAGLFLGLDHSFPLIHNILVETGILDGNDRLAAENVEDFAPVSA